MILLDSLREFFRTQAPLAPGDRVIVAFSGGGDSTALLWGLLQLSELQPIAVHLDHGLDPGSAGRAAAAARLAARLGAPFVAERRDVPALRQRGESVEAAARRVRYEVLEAARARLGARWVATAHHRDDQAETVVLRILAGSGVEGLAGIRPRHGTVVRPLLELPRAVLRQAIDQTMGQLGVTAVEDPTNDDLGIPRCRVRHRLLPALAAEVPDLPARLARLARLAGNARRADGALGRRLEAVLGHGGPDRAALDRLHPDLLPVALAALHRRAGAAHPAPAAARRELCRQLSRPAPVGCDCGGGWRWQEEDGRLALRPSSPRQPARPPRFTYTLIIPGEIAVPELSLKIRVGRAAVAPWMFSGSPRRAGLALPLTAGDRLTVRNRRPGDRVLPLGAPGSRRLKELLIDRRVPRQERDLLPLVCVGERIAWVPGVAIDERFRLEDGGAAWVVEVIPG